MSICFTTGQFEGCFSTGGSRTAIGSRNSILGRQSLILRAIWVDQRPPNVENRCSREIKPALEHLSLLFSLKINSFIFRSFEVSYTATWVLPSFPFTLPPSSSCPTSRPPSSFSSVSSSHLPTSPESCTFGVKPNFFLSLWFVNKRH